MIPGSSAGAASSFLEELPLLFTAALLKDMLEIQNGGSVIAYLTAEGYKNPYEAYASVRHYCETKMPDALLTLKPLKNLPRGPQKKTGRPRKTAEVVKEDKEGEAGAVPLVLQGGVNYQLKVDEAVQAEEKIRAAIDDYLG